MITAVMSDVIGGNTATAARYYPLNGRNIAPGSSAADSTIAGCGGVMPCSGSIIGYMIYSPDPGVGNSRTWDISKNGTAQGVSITQNNGTSLPLKQMMLATPVSFVAGDIILLIHTATGTPLSTQTTHFALLVQTTNNVSFVLGGTDGNINGATVTTDYYPVQGCGTNGTGAIAGREAIMPTSGTFRNFYVKLNAAPTAGKNYAFTLYKNGVATAITTTIADTATSNQDTTHSVSFAAGDAIAIGVLATGTPTNRNAGWGIEFDPDIDGESLQLIFSNGLNSTANRIGHCNEAGAWGASVTQGGIGLIDVACKKLYYRLTNAPGAGKSWTLSMLIQSGSVGSLAATISGASATTGNSVGTSSDLILVSSLTPWNFAASIGSQADPLMQALGSGSPANTQHAAGWVSYIPPYRTLPSIGVGT